MSSGVSSNVPHRLKSDTMDPYLINFVVTGSSFLVCGTITQYFQRKTKPSAKLFFILDSQNTVTIKQEAVTNRLLLIQYNLLSEKPNSLQPQYYKNRFRLWDLTYDLLTDGHLENTTFHVHQSKRQNVHLKID